MSRVLTHITALRFGHARAKWMAIASLSGAAAYTLATLQFKGHAKPLSLEAVYRTMLQVLELHQINAAVEELEKAGLIKRGFREELVAWRALPNQVTSDIQPRKDGVVA